MLPTDLAVSQLARQLYRDAPLVARGLQRGRPFICPMAPLLAAVPADATLLDVGCGAGLFALSAAVFARASRVVGIDPSARALEAARRGAENLRRNDPDLRCEIDWVEASSPASWPSGPFDVVSLIDVLHHIDPSMQRDFVLGAAERVRHGGVLIFKDMCERPRWRAAANRLHDLLLARQWIHYVPITTVESWLAERGFARVGREDFARFCYGHELLVMRRSTA